MNGTTTTTAHQPANTFAAFWLGRATEKASAHPRFFVRKSMGALAPWIAANVDRDGNLCEKLSTTARATGLTRTQVRSTYREFQRAGFLRSEFRKAYDGTALPTKYALGHPASVVDAELEAMTSEGAPA